MKEHKKHSAVWFIIFLGFVVGCAWYVLLWQERTTLQVSFLDVGQGDAIYIRAPSGHDLLIDSGSGSVVLRALGAVMPFYDRTIDAVVATHPDKDHVGGFADVLGRYQVNAIFESGNFDTTETARAFEAARDREARTEGAEVYDARRGTVIDLGGGAEFDILYPDHDTTTDDTNTASIVGVLHYGSTAFVLTGDAPRIVERHLVALNPTDLFAQVLKPGHHGSHTSSDPAFIAAVHPTYAVISAGKNNRYGHPHKETLDILAAAGATTVSTIDRGTVTFESDGTNVWMDD
ncbi:MAG: ComEC/Rec2 family competence protein [Minisyncoccota bacterium]